MFGNGRKTIGVIICDVSSHYQEQVCHTLSDHAEKAGYNIVFFTFFTGYGGIQTRNGRGESNIVYLIPFDKLDAVILCHDTLWNERPLEYIWEAIEEKCDCPVVTLRQDTGRYPCVVSDSGHCIKQIVDHLVDEHHLTKFGFMNGVPDHPDSVSRLNEFKKALADREIAFDDSMVFEGDFWKQKGKEAADYFTMELDERPEAIVCANDYMAISLINELIAKGIFVPDDIAVTGFDNIWEASIAMPPVTTVAVSGSDMAETAMGMIEKIWAGETVARVARVPASLVLRNSCGCQKLDLPSLFSRHVRQEKEHEKIMESNLAITYMVNEMSNLDTVDKIEKHIRLGDIFDGHTENFFVCLGEGRKGEFPKYRSSDVGYAKKSKVVGGYFHGKSCVSASYDTDALLPEEVWEEEPMKYYLFPLHFNQYSFGYFALSFGGTYSINASFQSCLAILGNALETIRIKQKNQGLLMELNNLYVHDSLTGLYNRRGFESFSAGYYDRAKKENRNFVVAAIDMDNLKVINDQFGHMNGDLALKTIGMAMHKAAGEDDICARVGGDEFSIVGIGYTHDTIGALLETFAGYLEEFNGSSDLPFLVKASVGYDLLEAGQDRELEECIKRADAGLYENKRIKKEKKDDMVLKEEKR